MALDLNELQKLLDNAKQSAANEKEIRKSLGRVETLMSNIAKELDHVYSLLPSDSTKSKKDSGLPGRAPGQKKDGTARKKPGRKKKEAAPVAEEA